MTTNPQSSSGISTTSNPRSKRSMPFIFMFDCNNKSSNRICGSPLSGEDLIPLLPSFPIAPPTATNYTNTVTYGSNLHSSHLCINYQRSPCSAHHLFDDMPHSVFGSFELIRAVLFQMFLCPKIQRALTIFSLFMMLWCISPYLEPMLLAHISWFFIPLLLRSPV
ncbi:unnamed protein product [Lactuca saligna]|uniref:Uncharacterized protein n=1 Tax=Lactuca saligna TaxID=75948 RepID=A0AA36EE58_LACSI|nr:unnamed protein product [Lactuca saligna]